MINKEKKVVVLQSNYLPWKGYFDLIRSADLFVFYDDVQFTKNDWRNRNKIKTPKGTEWISIPCGTNLKRLINEVKIKDGSWQADHWNRLNLHYSKAEYFSLYKDFFEDFYLRRKWKNLSELNQYLIFNIARRFLGLSAEFQNSKDYTLSGKSMDRLLDLLKKVGATRYISGPSAKEYISEESFIKTNIELTWMDYSNYPEYRQQFPPFAHNVSIVDLLFNEGPHAIHYLSSAQLTKS